MDEFEDSDDEDDEVLSAGLSFAGNPEMTNPATHEEFTGLLDTAEAEHSDDLIPPISLSEPTTPSEVTPARAVQAPRQQVGDGRQCMTIVIKDVAYSTYKAILYYVGNFLWLRSSPH